MRKDLDKENSNVSLSGVSRGRRFPGAGRRHWLRTKNIQIEIMQCRPSYSHGMSQGRQGNDQIHFAGYLIDRYSDTAAVPFRVEETLATSKVLTRFQNKMCDDAVL